MRRWLFLLTQYLVPHHGLGHVIAWFTHHRWPILSPLLIWIYQRVYRISLQEAELPHRHDYPTLQAFFTRALRADARPLASAPHTLTCPSDGILTAYGACVDTEIVVKGQSYSVTALTQQTSVQAEQFAVFYLAPHNYHRVHMPCAGRLIQVTHIPGPLFSVSRAGQTWIPQLFSRNERVVTSFETAYGPLHLIFVGAMIVGGITVHPLGPITPTHRHPRTPLQPCDFVQGQELGYFTFGSSVVMLWQQGVDGWHHAVDHAVQHGQALAQLKSTNYE